VIVVECDGLDEIVEVFNATLAERGDERQFYALDFDEYMYICLNKAQHAALVDGKVLPIKQEEEP